jgi:hypothetical protein
MTPLPHADEPAAQISGHLWVVGAERGLAEGIPLRPRRVTMTAPRPSRPNRPTPASRQQRINKQLLAHAVEQRWR